MVLARTPLGDLWAWLLSLPEWQAFALLFGTTLVAAKLLQVGGDLAIKRVTKYIPTDVDSVVFRTVHPPLYVTVVLVGTYLSVRSLGVVAGLSGPLQAGLVTILVGLWALTLTRAGRRVSNELIENNHMDAQVVPIFQNVWSVLVLGVSIFLVLSVWRIDVTPILASAGIIGIVVGLAARDTIANFFGSISLYFDGTYAVGDYIVLESGERGRVEDISIRSTVIRTRDDILVTVPNSVLNSARIINESTPDRDRRIGVEIGVAYGSDVAEVEALLLEIADTEDLVLDRPSPRARFREFGDSALQFELLCWVSDPVLRARATHELNKAVYKRLQSEGIEIPFPQRTVSFEGEDVPREVDAVTGEREN